MTTYATFDVADYLDNDEVVAEYLSAAMEDPDPPCSSPLFPTSPRHAVSGKLPTTLA